MEDVYELYKHKYCIITYIGTAEIYFDLYDILETETPKLIKTIREDSNISYTSGIDLKVKSITDGLYDLFQKKKLGGMYDEKDELALTCAISDFLRAAKEKLIASEGVNKIISFSLLHVCVIPSEWEDEIREDLIRPIFIKAELIQERDHKDRLVFISDIESICYNLKTPSNEKYSFKRGQNTIMRRIIPTKVDTVLFKLNLIKTTNTLFDIPNSMFFPKVLFSNSFSITWDDIKNCIRRYLKEKVFPMEFSDYDELIKEVGENIYKYIDNVMCKVKDCKIPYPYSLDNWLLRPILEDSTLTFLNSICPLDVYVAIGQTFFSGLNDIISNQVLKNCELLLLEDTNFFCASFDNKSTLCTWLNFTLEIQEALVLNSMVVNLTRIQLGSRQITQNLLSLGATNAITEIIKNSNMHCRPRLMHSKNDVTFLSTFQNFNLKAIININISLDSTLLSCYMLQNDESVKDGIDYDHTIASACLPSLGEFFDLKNSVTLNIKEQFISFAENCLLKKFNLIHKDKDFLKIVERFLSDSLLDRKKKICIHQKKYFMAFLLMYLVHIKEIIISKLFNLVKHKETKIGYVVSVEKIVVDNIINSIEDFEELIYKSGLVPKNNDSKKLRIITQGEGILSSIQRVFHLNFPVNSCFVIAQIHENYIQLNLNQVVTDSTLEDNEQEAIIIESRIIPINNIYDSLCLEIWNNLIHHNNLIRLCVLHNKSNSKDSISGLFCLKTKKLFMSKLKRYILDKILAANANFQKLQKVKIKISDRCNCHVYLHINDIIEISFKPFLKDITCSILAPLIDKNLFGRYTFIEYHFSILHFNNNQDFQEILVAMMKEEADQYKPSRGIDTLCVTLSKLQLARPELFFIYKGFVKGTLYPIYNNNYIIDILNGGMDKKIMATPYQILRRYDRIETIDLNIMFYCLEADETTSVEISEIFEHDVPAYKKRDRSINQSYTTRDNLEQISFWKHFSQQIPNVSSNKLTHTFESKKEYGQSDLETTVKKFLSCLSTKQKKYAKPSIQQRHTSASNDPTDMLVNKKENQKSAVKGILSEPSEKQKKYIKSPIRQRRTATSNTRIDVLNSEKGNKKSNPPATVKGVSSGSSERQNKYLELSFQQRHTSALNKRIDMLDSKKENQISNSHTTVKKISSDSSKNQKNYRKKWDAIPFRFSNPYYTPSLNTILSFRPLLNYKKNIDEAIPLLITVKYLGYSSSIQITVKVAGKDDHSNILRFNVGAPLTLGRY